MPGQGKRLALSVDSPPPQDKHHVLGRTGNLVRLPDVVGKVITLSDFELRDRLQQRQKLSMFVCTIFHVVNNAEPCRRREYINVKAQMFQALPAIDAF